MDLSLKEFVCMHKLYCTQRHGQPCLECTALLNIAQYVIQNGICVQSEVFKHTYPNL